MGAVGRQGPVYILHPGGRMPTVGTQIAESEMRPQMARGIHVADAREAVAAHGVGREIDPGGAGVGVLRGDAERDESRGGEEEREFHVCVSGEVVSESVSHLGVGPAPVGSGAARYNVSPCAWRDSMPDRSG